MEAVAENSTLERAHHQETFPKKKNQKQKIRGTTPLSNLSKSSWMPLTTGKYCKHPAAQLSAFWGTQIS